MGDNLAANDRYPLADVLLKIGRNIKLVIVYPPSTTLTYFGRPALKTLPTVACRPT